MKIKHFGNINYKMQHNNDLPKFRNTEYNISFFNNYIRIPLFNSSVG